MRSTSMIQGLLPDVMNGQVEGKPCIAHQRHDTELVFSQDSLGLNTVPAGPCVSWPVTHVLQSGTE